MSLWLKISARVPRWPGMPHSCVGCPGLAGHAWTPDVPLAFPWRALLVAAAVVAGSEPAAAAAEESTAYCLRGTMADGSYTRAGSVAHNGYALGTRLWIRPSPTGRRRYVVRDRIGWGTQLDFWTPSCAAALAWGRRTVQVRRGWPRLYLRLRARPKRPPRPWIPGLRQRLP